MRRPRGSSGWARVSWALVCALFLSVAPSAIASRAAPAAPAERPPALANKTSTDFFREKFECVRTVAEKAPDSKCLKCHAAILSQKPLQADSEKGSPPSIVSVHAQHMRSSMANFTCVACHKKIDPYESSSSGLRNQVPAALCFNCHFPHGRE